MKFHCVIFAVLLSQLDLISIANGANIDMYVTSTTMVAVNKDLSNTYGLKFCVKSDQGIIVTFSELQGTYTPYHRYTVDLAPAAPDGSLIRSIAASSVSARNYESGFVDFTQPVCFWTTWADNWYFVGKGDWGQNLIMNYRNKTQTTQFFGGMFLNVRSATPAAQAYVTIIDEAISKADAQTKSAATLAGDQVYAGPVTDPSNPNAPTTFTVTTTSGAPYQDVGYDLTGATSTWFTCTVSFNLYNCWVALCDKNNPDPNTNCYEFNAYRYEYAFSFGKGIGKTLLFNLNNYGFVQYPNDTPKKFWISWMAGVISIGTGDTTGVGTVLTWKDPTPININQAKIMSKDVGSTWTLATRYQATN
jgi:hypothetical protein